MSVVIETLLVCDGQTHSGNPVRNDGDCRHASASIQRRDAKEEGWHRVGSKDYCPDCWEARKAARDAAKGGAS